MNEITAVQEFSEQPRRYSLWRPTYQAAFNHGGGEHTSPEGPYDLMHFSETTGPGLMSEVLIIIAHMRDGSTIEFNATLLASIERAPDADTAEGDGT